MSVMIHSVPLLWLSVKLHNLWKCSRKRDQELEALVRLREDEIDTTDIPEVADWSKAVVGRFYRPIKEPITLRLDADLIAWLKSAGPGYQTRINAILRSILTRARK